MKSWKPILLSCLTFVLTAYSNAQLNKQESLNEDLQAYLTAIHSKKGFSGEILVAKGENILFWGATGLASVENNTVIKVGATYRIASITKTFTATLIALAQEENRLKVNDKASQYIKGLSTKFKDITIHQLLTHSSGLPHNEAIKDYWLTKSKLQMNTGQVIEEINKVDLLFPPGSQMNYSSLGYYLLATLLEAVYKEEFPTILEKKILNKLHMKETGTATTLKIIPKMTSGYHLVTDDSLVVAPYRNYSMLKGAGDMYATAADLLKWNNSFLLNKLLKEKTKELLFTPNEIPHHSENRKYGYGWFIKSEKEKRYYHGGGTFGYSSLLAIYPGDSISIILLSNVSALPTESIALDIEKIVFKQPFVMPVSETEVPQDSISLKIYSGNFISESGKMKLTVMSNENGVFAQLAGNPPFEIYPKGNHTFFGKKIEIEITFETDKGVISGLTAKRMGQLFHFKKL